MGSKIIKNADIDKRASLLPSPTPWGGNSEEKVGDYSIKFVHLLTLGCLMERVKTVVIGDGIQFHPVSSVFVPTTKRASVFFRFFFPSCSRQFFSILAWTIFYLAIDYCITPLISVG